MSRAEALAAALAGAAGSQTIESRAVLDSLPIAIYTTDAAGVVTYFNRAAAELAGREPRLNADRWCVCWRLHRPDGTRLPTDQCPMADALREKRAIRGEELIVARPDGTMVPVLPYPTPIFDAEGEMTGAVNVLIDIGKRKAAEQELRTKTNRIQALDRIARLLSSDLNVEHIVQTVTDSATELTGAKFGAFFYNVVDETGEHFQLFTLSGAPREAFENFGLPRNTAVFAPTFKGERVVRSNDIRKDPLYGLSSPHFGMPQGHLPVVSYLAVPVIARSGAVLGGLFFGHDAPGVFTRDSEDTIVAIAAHAAIAIDNARLLADSQRQSECRRIAELSARHLASIVESSDDAIVSKDLNGIVTSWNRGAEALFGYSVQEMAGTPIMRLIPKGHEDEERQILDRVRRGERIDHYETRRQRKDGTFVDISLTISPIMDDDGRIVGASKIARDISERKASEVALAERLREQASLYQFTERVHRARSIAAVYEAALDAIQSALRCSRASILLIDETGTMHFVASRGLSESYRLAVDGHSPWGAEAQDPNPIFIEDLELADIPDNLRAAVRTEGIGALGFIPLVAVGRLIGKFMTYYDTAHHFAGSEIDLALTIARQLSFSVQRIRSEEARRRAEDLLRHNEAKERARATEVLALMEAVPAPIWIARTPDCRVISGNRSSFELLRLPPDSNPSLSAPASERPAHFKVYSQGSLLSPDELPVQRAACGEEVRNFEQEIRFDDGTSRHLLGNATPLIDALGIPQGAVAAFVDITERKETEQAMRDGERRLQMALEAGRMGAWEWNFDTGKVIWSPGLEALHGLEPGTFGGTPHDFKADIHPDDLAMVELEIQTAVDTQEDYHTSYRICRPDGSIRWLEAFGRFLPRAGSSSQRLAGVCMDITERKDAEAQRNLLVAELSHRVKNTLATVTSIARQSFAMTPDRKEAEQSFHARIRALAQTHTRLAEATWAGASLETILCDELAPYKNENAGNVSFGGPAIMLSPRHALALGMAAHELATNAAKHGALSVEGGHVDVSWSLDPANKALHIGWCETGGPAVASPSRNGFGRLLLERVVGSDLGGEVELDFAKSGLRYTINMPYSAGAER
ncbi:MULTISPECIES: PAS domain S-box protein [unclassified Ensifer]|uniref:PAS domain S-box protein n=1 Tax=unclassified Ensifer TaxID=2633371 RepID=UPI000813C90D|nr:MULTISPECIES: PAS domain S-box protein [unclassified Ensifer]OCP16038.1 histidine kinase [Ensifer sp. LC384]OCP20107.1 histidine kinase [Ensifer sp. LC54]